MNRKRWMLLALGAALTGWLIWGNSALQVTSYRISQPNLPEGFDGFRIAQVSDLHNTRFGQENETLLAALKEARPDIIVFTGDLVDCRRTDVSVALSFAQRAAEIAPCYYVTGNHEARLLEETPLLLAALAEAGVTPLENEAIHLERKGDTLTLLGVHDPSYKADYEVDNNEFIMARVLDGLLPRDGAYAILLSHRPELFPVYREKGVDLVFSGHAHGGQFRLPFLGAIYAPYQGFFPKYESGVVTEGSTTMVVSRGLGPSVIPLRVNNRPELVVAQLHRG